MLITIRCSDSVMINVYSAQLCLNSLSESLLWSHFVLSRQIYIRAGFFSFFLSFVSQHITAETK